MRLSQYFLPTLRETPSEAQIVSHRYMLRAGMIKQASAGIYSWLPLGFRVLKKIEQIVREEQDAAGAIEMLMPTIQSADLWKQSGRYEAYGAEMLRITDRHDREMLYGPTNEEQLTEIFRDLVKTYKNAGKILYHIQWKFRDEVRPRFGLMRGREFLMKDSYSFDLDYPSARHSYNKMFVSYLRTFARLGMKAIPMRAATGPIGGDLSHEFIILAETGESEVYLDKKLLEKDPLTTGINYNADLSAAVESWTSLYAATDEKHDPGNCPIPPADLIKSRGIEVGHIFYFGTKYSLPMKAIVDGPNGKPVVLEMGSYGIGVSRLVAAIIEASHDKDGIIWPESVAPYKVGLLNLKQGDAACDAMAEKLVGLFESANIEYLYDDRDERAGSKLADMDLIGLPWQVIIGPRSVGSGMVELKNRRTGQRQEILPEQALAKLV